MGKFNSFKAAVSRGYLRAGVAVVTSVPMLAMAQVTDPFETQVALAETKVETYMPMLATLAGIAVIFWIAIKYIKKIRGVA